MIVYEYIKEKHTAHKPHNSNQNMKSLQFNTLKVPLNHSDRHNNMMRTMLDNVPHYLKINN